MVESGERKKAVRFAKAVDDTIESIACFPDLGSPWDSPDADLTNMRFWIVKRFRRYLLVYERIKKVVVIHRILHGSQNIEELLKH